jgi:hypothetical protein
MASQKYNFSELKMRLNKMLLLVTILRPTGVVKSNSGWMQVWTYDQIF